MQLSDNDYHFTRGYTNQPRKWLEEAQLYPSMSQVSIFYSKNAFWGALKFIILPLPLFCLILTTAHGSRQEKLRKRRDFFMHMASEWWNQDQALFSIRYLHNMPDKKARVTNLLWRGSCPQCAQVWTRKTGRFLHMMEKETPRTRPGDSMLRSKKRWRTWGQGWKDILGDAFLRTPQNLWHRKRSYVEFYRIKKISNAFYLRNRDEIGTCEEFSVDMNSLGKPW